MTVAALLAVAASALGEDARLPLPLPLLDRRELELAEPAAPLLVPSGVVVPVAPSALLGEPLCVAQAEGAALPLGGSAEPEKLEERQLDAVLLTEALRDAEGQGEGDPLGAAPVALPGALRLPWLLPVAPASEELGALLPVPLLLLLLLTLWEPMSLTLKQLLPLADAAAEAVAGKPLREAAGDPLAELK